MDMSLDQIIDVVTALPQGVTIDEGWTSEDWEYDFHLYQTLGAEDYLLYVYHLAAGYLDSEGEYSS